MRGKRGRGWEGREGREGEGGEGGEGGKERGGEERKVEVGEEVREGRGGEGGEGGERGEGRGGGGEWRRRKSYASIMIYGKNVRLPLVLDMGGSE